MSINYNNDPEKNLTREELASYMIFLNNIIDEQRKMMGYQNKILNESLETQNNMLNDSLKNQKEIFNSILDYQMEIMSHRKEGDDSYNRLKNNDDKQHNYNHQCNHQDMVDKKENDMIVQKYNKHKEINRVPEEINDVLNNLSKKLNKHKSIIITEIYNRFVYDFDIDLNRKVKEYAKVIGYRTCNRAYVISQNKKLRTIFYKIVHEMERQDK